jgi:predicted SnoaL-like aldol condensation-catalyzing enzyme
MRILSTAKSISLSLLTAVIAAGLPGCSKAEAPPPAVTTAPPVVFDPVAVVSKLLTTMGSKDPAALAAIDPNHFVQHDLSIGDGLAGLKVYLDALPANSLKITPVRLFRDGELVVAHSLDQGTTPEVRFDVFRFEKEKIVEHWDNVQVLIPGPNPGGHTMTDGPTAVTDDAATEANKAMAKQFVTDVLIGEKLDGYDAFFDGGKYIQHDPGVPDGAAFIKTYIQNQIAANKPIGYDAVRRVVGQGNFVLVISSGSPQGRATAFYDLFRLEKGKLAEHWAVTEPIPPREDWKNGSSGKF